MLERIDVIKTKFYIEIKWFLDLWYQQLINLVEMRGRTSCNYENQQWRHNSDNHADYPGRINIHEVPGNSESNADEHTYKSEIEEALYSLSETEREIFGEIEVRSFKRLTQCEKMTGTEEVLSHC